MEKFKAREENWEEIDEIKHLFRNSKIKCIKYNHCLDESVQQHRCYDSYLHLNKDYLQIVCKRVLFKEKDYINEDD